MNDVMYSDIMYDYDHRDKNKSFSCRQCKIASIETIKVGAPNDSNIPKGTIINDIIFTCSENHGIVNKVRYGCLSSEPFDTPQSCSECRFSELGPVMETVINEGKRESPCKVMQQLYKCKCYKHPFKKNEYAKPYFRCENFKRKKNNLNED